MGDGRLNVIEETEGRPKDKKVQTRSREGRVCVRADYWRRGFRIL